MVKLLLLLLSLFVDLQKCLFVCLFVCICDCFGLFWFVCFFVFLVGWLAGWLAGYLSKLRKCKFSRKGSKRCLGLGCPVSVRYAWRAVETSGKGADGAGLPLSQVDDG